MILKTFFKKSECLIVSISKISFFIQIFYVIIVVRKILIKKLETKH